MLESYDKKESINKPPIISGKDEDLGVKNNSFSIKYNISSSNTETTTFNVKEILDDMNLRAFDGMKDIDYVTTIRDSTFYKLENGQHTLTIKISDGVNSATRQYTFIKNESSIDLKLSKIVDTGKQAKSILLIPEWSGIENNDVKIEVCNNAYDLEPIWEDATTVIKNGQKHIFNNTKKNADKWGIDIHFICNRKNDNSTMLIKGFKADIFI